MTADNVSTQRFARHPALADLFRALRLVEKQGLGVDRRYREMVTLGHRPPVITEVNGPRVHVRLVGGAPVVPVMMLAGRVEPSVRRRDVRVALILDTLLHKPFVTPELMAEVLQRTSAEAAEALDVASECRVRGQPIISHFKDVWVLSRTALAIVEDTPWPVRRSRGLLPYRRPANAFDVARSWLKVHDRITSGDHATLTGLTQPGALKQLERLVADGYLTRGEGSGRSAHFLATDRLC